RPLRTPTLPSTRPDCPIGSGYATARSAADMARLRGEHESKDDEASTGLARLGADLDRAELASNSERRRMALQDFDAGRRSSATTTSVRECEARRTRTNPEASPRREH